MTARHRLPRPARAPAAARSGLTRAEERALVAAARAGDARAMTRLLRLVSDPALRFGRGFCRDPEDAQEVMQDVLSALVRSLKDFRGEAALTTWAYTVARHACMRRRRRRVDEPAHLETLDAPGDGGAAALEVPDASDDPHGRLERRELGEILERGIAALPAAQRAVLVLRDVEGLTAGEVGRVLGLSERAVKSRLHRARIALRESLAPTLGRTAAGGERSQAAAIGRHGCPDTARLVSRYLEGELSSATCAALARHVERCPSCGEICDTLRSALGACRDLGRRPLPDEVRERVRAAMRDLVQVWPGVASPRARA